ncbi:hypothetical protein EVAR_80825_1 [Eumeta japonica]|uniref:Mariner Mos1 transposase n=1 Tax=Eumeta variegata TaxID=151549 RepID=A0A4C1WGA9_EUMVA|nr:hypothetical protein EVAR_80825_1 [Eumeta japonica]
MLWVRLEWHYSLQAFTPGRNHQFGSLIATDNQTQARSTEKRPELINRKGFFVHYDDARPHTFLATYQNNAGRYLIWWVWRESCVFANKILISVREARGGLNSAGAGRLPRRDSGVCAVKSLNIPHRLARDSLFNLNRFVAWIQVPMDEF